MIVVSVTVVSILGGGGNRLAGDARPIPTARQVAEQFLQIETLRYNAGSLDNAPLPTVAAYQGVSCAQDLAEMRASGAATPPPATTPITLFTFKIESITPITAPEPGTRPDPNAPQLLDIQRTTITPADAGDTADGLFYLRIENGRWRMCGEFPDTQPPDGSGAAQAGAGQAASG